MIKFDSTNVVGFESIIRAMHNFRNSWGDSDSGICPNGTEFGYCYLDHRKYCPRQNTDDPAFCVGPKDLDLLTRICHNGLYRSKLLQGITVCVNITAPLYWWKEFVTYKVDKADCDPMIPRLVDKEFTHEDFSCEHLRSSSIELLDKNIVHLNYERVNYLSTKDIDAKKAYLLQIVQLLPSSYNQENTVMLNYKVLAKIYSSYKDHMLDEWREFCKWIESLPYSELITQNEKPTEDHIFLTRKLNH